MLPTSTQITVQVKAVASTCPAVFIEEGAPARSIADIPSTVSTALRRLVAAGVAKGKAREVHFDLIDAGKGKVNRVYVIGVGKGDVATLDAFRQAGGALAKA